MLHQLLLAILYWKLHGKHFDCMLQSFTVSLLLAAVPLSIGLQVRFLVTGAVFLIEPNCKHARVFLGWSKIIRSLPLRHALWPMFSATSPKFEIRLQCAGLVVLSYLIFTFVTLSRRWPHDQWLWGLGGHALLERDWRGSAVAMLTQSDSAVKSPQVHTPGAKHLWYASKSPPNIF